MNRSVRACAFIFLAGVLAACTNLGIFEDVGDDPHPPQIQLLGVAYKPMEATPEPAPEPEPEPEPKMAVAAGRAASLQFLPPDGFVVRPYDSAANSLAFRVQYFDAGGDIDSIMFRDLDSNQGGSLSIIPAEAGTEGDGTTDTEPVLAYFPGTSGTVDLGYVAFTAGVEGPHRIELWAEDGHGSRSAKITFTLTFVY
jgi:hypothetical protein